MRAIASLLLLAGTAACVEEPGRQEQESATAQVPAEADAEAVKAEQKTIEEAADAAAKLVEEETLEEIGRMEAEQSE
jgi:hypothetical protein